MTENELNEGSAVTVNKPPHARDSKRIKRTRKRKRRRRRRVLKSKTDRQNIKGYEEETDRRDIKVDEEETDRKDSKVYEEEELLSVEEIFRLTQKRLADHAPTNESSSL